MEWWQWMGVVGCLLLGLAVLARGWIGWTYPRRLDRGKIAWALQRRFGPWWMVFDIAVMETPIVAAAATALMDQWSPTGPLMAAAAAYAWIRFIDDWLVDDDDRWKRRRARARNRVKWRMRLPAPEPA